MSIKGLRDYIDLKAEADNLAELIVRLKNNMLVKSTTLKDTPASGTNAKDKMASQLARIEEIQDKLVESITLTVERINLIEEPKHRRVLYLKYIKGYKVNDIAEDMKYSKPQVERYLRDALDKF